MSQLKLQSYQEMNCIVSFAIGASPRGLAGLREFPVTETGQVKKISTLTIFAVTLK